MQTRRELGREDSTVVLSMPLTVIGAGLCRTGTTSLTAALDNLGCGPCYHMRGNVEHGDSLAWIEVHRAVKAGQSLEALHERFEAIWHKEGKEYRSACDYPSQVFYKQLADIYPDAKVVRLAADRVKCLLNEVKLRAAAHARAAAPGRYRPRLINLLSCIKTRWVAISNS
jgi:Sulfotransferase domain